MSRLVGGASPSIGVLTVFLLATLTLSGVFASPAAFASSSSPSFKHVDLVSPDPQNFGLFGDSVASNAALVVVGAPFETSGGKGAAGNAYIFNSKTGVLISSLASPEPQGYGQFGYSVAISGSLIVVGAPYEASNGQDEAGNAYAFNATTGALVQSFTSPNPQYKGWFGYSVSVLGRLVVVGAPYESSNDQTEAGNAYVFNATTGALIDSFTSPNPQYQGWFGYSVAVGGNNVVVGAADEYNGEGRAYIYAASTGSVTETLVSPNNQEGGAFGSAVAISGNVVVIGAYEENTGGVSQAGNAYTFNVHTGALISQLNSDPQSTAFFGTSVAIDGNALAVGAPDQNTGEPLGGVAFTYNVKTGALTHTLTNPDKNFSGAFGVSVSVSGKDFMVGAPLQIVRPHHKCGEAFIFQLGS